MAGSLLPSAAGGQTRGKTGALGVLVDTTVCIGCRKCELACDRVNKLSDKPLKPLEAFEDPSVFERPRRMKADEFTVVNRYPHPENLEKPVYTKIQCMHCLHPACASACLVGALTREENGAVVYDAHKCMGCRYCMIACPFQVPSYEYGRALTPRVRKCTFCYERVAGQGLIPACAEICPVECLSFGKRAELLALAHEKILENPRRYVDHVYGEREVGGTSWLYLAPRRFEELGFLKLGEESVTEITETIQHGLFKFGVPPLLLFGLLGASMRVFRDRENEKKHSEENTL